MFVKIVVTVIKAENEKRFSITLVVPVFQTVEIGHVVVLFHIAEQSVESSRSYRVPEGVALIRDTVNAQHRQLARFPVPEQRGHSEMVSTIEQ